jgi:hypothetical protein
MVVTPLAALADVGATWEDWGGIWGGRKDPVHFQYPGFQAPSVSSQDSPSLIKLCDFLSGFTPGLGQVQLGELIAQWIDPIPEDSPSFDRKLQKFINGPCTELYRRL